MNVPIAIRSHFLIFVWPTNNGFSEEKKICAKSNENDNFFDCRRVNHYDAVDAIRIDNSQSKDIYKIFICSDILTMQHSYFSCNLTLKKWKICKSCVREYFSISGKYLTAYVMSFTAKLSHTLYSIDIVTRWKSQSQCLYLVKVVSGFRLVGLLHLAHNIGDKCIKK